MDEIIDWLMEGDAAIRWQTLRDLLGTPERDCQAERQRTLQEGWGAQFLARQDANGAGGRSPWYARIQKGTGAAGFTHPSGLPPPTPC
jgi:hypothetical protein